MADCCSYIYDLGCFDHCMSDGAGTFTISVLTASTTGTHKLQIVGTGWYASQSITSGNTIEFDNIYFNEDKIIEVKVLDPNGSYMTYTTGGVEYDCFQVRVRTSLNLTA